MDFEGATQKKNKHRLLFLIDEFPSLKRMELFGDALSYMAGYGLKAYLITQDIRQTPDEILRLTPARKQGHGESEEIVAPGQMLIFVSGHYPILGTQMLYFSDAALAKRAKISPPIQFFSLERGGTVEQPPLHQTPNVMSRPEIMAEGGESGATYASAMEKGFAEQLELDKRGLIHPQER